MNFDTIRSVSHDYISSYYKTVCRPWFHSSFLTSFLIRTKIYQSCISSLSVVLVCFHHVIWWVYQFILLLRCHYYLCMWLLSCWQFYLAALGTTSTSCARGRTIYPAPVGRTLQPSSSPYTPYACGAKRALRHEYSLSRGSGSLWLWL